MGCRIQWVILDRLGRWSCVWRILPVILGGFSLLELPLPVRAQSNPPPQSRAQRPDWQARPLPDYLFPDAAAEGLAIQRDSGSPQETHSSPNESTSSPSATSGSAGMIQADTLEDEVKAQAKRLDAALIHESHFQGGGDQDARDSFAWLAALFATISEHPEEVRWQRSSLGAAARFAQLASTMPHGDPQAFQIARTGRDELKELLDGTATYPDPRSKQSIPWGAYIDRSVLMRRMEAANKDTLSAAWRDRKVFLRSKEQIAAAAEIMGLCGDLISKQDVEGTDDEDYLAFARPLRDHAAALTRAVHEGNYDDARRHWGEVNQACDACHEQYR